MSRPEFKLEAWHFTTMSALSREILSLLECTDYKLIVQCTTLAQVENLQNELESCRTMSRVKVEVVG